MQRHPEPAAFVGPPYYLDLRWKRFAVVEAHTTPEALEILLGDNPQDMHQIGS
jgi:hypothetical protein